MAGNYNIQSLIKGNTFVARNIARISKGGVPIALSRALVEMRDGTGQLIYSWDTEASPATAEITGADSNIVTMNEVSELITAGWAARTHSYEVTVWFAATGQKLTIIRGEFKVIK